MSVFGVILVHNSSTFFHIQTEYREIRNISSYSVRMLENEGKMPTTITPNKDTFYAVLHINIAKKKICLSLATLFIFCHENFFSWSWYNQDLGNDIIFCGQNILPKESDKTKRLWYLLLRKLWPLLFNFWRKDWTLAGISTQFCFHFLIS